MTTSSPASMGGPLSEAERLAEIQARVDNLAYHTPPWSVEHDCFGTDIHFGDHDQVNDADGDLVAATDYSEVANLLVNAASDLEFLLSLVGVLEGQLATAREELGELLPIASPYRTTKADRDRNWLHGAWESFAARAKTARAAANRWAREADRLEEWAAKRKSEKDAGTWPPCQGCDEHPARALGLDGGDPDER